MTAKSHSSTTAWFKTLDTLLLCVQSDLYINLCSGKQNNIPSFTFFIVSCVKITLLFKLPAKMFYYEYMDTFVISGTKCAMHYLKCGKSICKQIFVWKDFDNAKSELQYHVQLRLDESSKNSYSKINIQTRDK